MGDLQPLFKENLKPKTPGGESSTPAPRLCWECQKPNPRPYGGLCPECQAEEDKQEAIAREDKLGRVRVALADEWLKTCGIPPRYSTVRLSTFHRDLQPQAYDMAERYITKLTITDDFNDDGTPFICPMEIRAPSLMLGSKGNGTGKTHLAVAIALRFMRVYLDSCLWQPGAVTVEGNTRPPVLFTTIPRMLLRIRATYREEAAESESDVISDLATIPLLVLDDVGKEKPSDHTRQTYFTVIDTRYGAELPVVITSNLTLPKQLKQFNEVMGEATMSRLKEMTEGWRVVMEGEDYRYRESKP